MDEDSLNSVAKTGKKRLWNRRWAKTCKDCGCPVIFLDNTQPAVPGKRWSPWVVVELYGQRDGELLPWGGEIAYDPRKHVKHQDCIGQKRRLARFLARITEDI